MGSSSVDPYLGKQLVKNFTLRRNLGSGEIGVVYEATNDDASRRVAVKVLHPDVAEAHGTDLVVVVVLWNQHCAGHPTCCEVP